MKKIGFIDYYISEWHANNYPAWIKQICEKEGYNYKVAYAWAELEKSPVTSETTDEWCARMEVEKCETIEELCEKSDVLIILAPSNPEKHLGYAEKALAYGKRTYIDKTFAPDYATAVKIFEAGKKGDADFFSSSALRYATELDELLGGQYVITQGGGGNYEEYIIHQIEMIVKIFGVSATEVCVETQGRQVISRVKFADGRQATMVYAPAYPFTICVEDQFGKNVYRKIDSDMFNELLTDVLYFFETGEKSFDGAQTLEVMKIREAVIKAKSEAGVWLKA